MLTRHGADHFQNRLLMNVVIILMNNLLALTIYLQTLVAPPLSCCATATASSVGGDPVDGATPAARTARTDSLGARIEARLDETGLEFGVAYRDLGSGREVLLNPDREFHAASTMKVPVMVRLFRMAERGALSLDDSLRITNRFTSIYDSSTYRLSPEDDSDPALYDRVGDPVPVRELVQRMIARSSNLATNELIRLADAAETRAMLERIGAGGLQVLRGVEDIPAYRQGINNTTTARALLELLSALARGALAGQDATREMISILEAQHFNEGIPGGLPDSVDVAHKTGWITGIVHDAAVVEPPGRAPYVLVVLTRGEVEAERTRRAIADVSRMIWEAY